MFLAFFLSSNFYLIPHIHLQCHNNKKIEVWLPVSLNENIFIVEKEFHNSETVDLVCIDYSKIISLKLAPLFRKVTLAGDCMFKVNNRTTRARCEICSKLTMKAHEWRHSGGFIVNFEHISHLALVFLLLTLSRQMPAGYVRFSLLSILKKRYFRT